MKQKKLLASLLALTLACGSLAGCGAAGDEVSKESESKATVESEVKQSSESQEVEEPAEPVNIVLFRRDSDALNTTNDVVLEALNEYLLDKINVTIDFIDEPSGYSLDRMLAAGEEVHMWWDTGIARFSSRIEMGAGYDITDLLENYPALVDSMPDYCWETSKYAGRNWCVPVYKDLASGMGVLFRKEYVDKYGWDLSTIKTFADIEPMLKDMKEDGIEYPYVKHHIMFDNAWGLDDFAFIKPYAGVSRDGDTTKVVDITKTEEYKEYLDLMYSWNQKGYISQGEQVQLQPKALNELYANGQAGVVWWNTVPDNQNQAELNSAFDPVAVETTKVYMDCSSVVMSYYMLNASNTEEEVDACLKFLELMNTDKVVGNLMAYGVEGVHYNYNADGQVELIPDNGYKYTGRWAATGVNGVDFMVGEKPDTVALTHEFNDSAVVSVTSGFTFNQESVAAEIAAIDGVISEYKRLLEHGFYNPDEYLPKYQDALAKAGIDKVLAEIQKQWDEFLAAK